MFCLALVGDLVVAGLWIARLQPRPVPPVALPPGPTVTAPMNPPLIAQRDFPQSAQRQLAKARPVLLGDLDLTGYCEDEVGAFSLAVRLGDDWACVRMGEAPAPIPLTAACRAQYDTGTAVARRAAQTWRCYRDAT